MMNIFAGLRSQIKSLKDRLKALDTSKKNQKEVKEVVDALNALEERYAKERTRREEKRKVKEQKSLQEVEKEAVSKPEVEEGKVILPKDEFIKEHEHLNKLLKPIETERKEQVEELKEVKEASPKCAICGVEFKSYPEYNNHREEAHGVAREYSPMDLNQKRDVVKNVEKNLGPAIISEKEPKAELIKFSTDDQVVPSRGEESIGTVLRHDSPKSLCYVLWQSGPLKEKHVAGGYYTEDLKHYQEPKQDIKAEGNPPPPDTSIIPKGEPPHNPGPEHICPDCKDWHTKHADLKGNYDALLKDLKEERATHYEQGNYKWVTRLDEKIQDMEKAIAEKFGNEKTAAGQVTLKQNGQVKKTFATYNEALMWLHRNTDYSWDYAQKHQGWTIEEGNEKEAGAQNAIELTIMDHTPPRANVTKDEGGKDENDSEFQSEWAEPKIASINVFNKKWSAKAITKENKLSYDVMDESGKKILSISPINGKEMNAEHLQWAAERELQKGYKKGTLKENLAFLKVGSKVLILASDKVKGKIKFASLEHGVRGWCKESSIQLEALESQAVSHNGHSDKVLGQTGSETLLDCIEGGPIWVNSTELLDANRPPATPEALHEEPESLNLEEAKKCRTCGKDSREDLCPGCKRIKEVSESNRPAGYDKPETKESSKDCPDCHGNFAGKENEKCPTCGRFSVQKKAAKSCPICEMQDMIKENGSWVCPQCQYTLPIREENKEALKTALPSVLPNQRGYLDNPPVEKKAEYSGYTNYSTWGLALHLDNDQDLYNQSREMAKQHISNESLAAELAATYNTLLEEKGEKDKDANEVNWNEIAQELLDESKENAEYERSQGAGGVIDKLPTMDVEQAKDDLLNQLAKETDPERKKSLEQKYKRLSMNSNLNKVARVVHQKDGWHVLSEKGKNLGGPYKTKGEAVKRLRSVEYWKSHKGSIRPFSKKTAAEVMVDPYQSLTNHITEMRQRMSDVQTRLETAPLPKQAGVDEKDNSEMSIEEVFSDISMGLDLLETKLKDEPESEELHKSLEELENLLWETEQKAGITPELSEHEKEEPEHASVVKEVEEKEEKEPVEKEEIIEINAAAVPNPALGQPIPPAPAARPTQPTDENNLGVPTQMPTSKTPPGTKWTWDAANGKFVIMNDPMQPGKNI